VTLLVSAMMFLPAPPLDREDIPAERVTIPLAPLTFLSCFAGIVVGFLGAGNFAFVPLLIYLFKVPTRMAIGSSLFIAMLNTLSGFFGKLITGQIPFLMSLAVVLGAGIGALGGEWIHSRVSPRFLRYTYAGMVGLITVRIWITLLVG